MVNLYPTLYNIRMLTPMIMVMLTSCFIIMNASIASAASSAPNMRDADQCMRYFRVYEAKYNIPPLLLKAISINESGRWHSSQQDRVAWPWTLNVAGKGFYFDSKREAIQTVRNYINSGAKSFDVGCMQINMFYHGDAFRSLQQAFNPKYNVAYAASLLRRHYDKTKSWDKAVAYYHSKTYSKGTQYVKRVRKIWHGLRKTAYHVSLPPRERKVASIAGTTSSRKGFSKNAYPVSARKPQSKHVID